ncbi:MAG TPA: EamA family transporter [Polyangia bacterium]|nr:EamA family transporter [Polyangia bacterium]
MSAPAASLVESAAVLAPSPSPSPSPSPTLGPPHRGPSRALVLTAYATLYVVWGSTYLAIRIAVESWTPLLLAATRFAIAGGGLYAVLRARGAPTPGRRAWLAAVLVGGLMLAGGNGTVCWAEQWVPSGETSLILASGALWMVVLPWWTGRAPAPRAVVLVGVLVGMAGVALLMGGGHATDAAATLGGRASPLGRVALLAASLSWVIGSLLSRRLPLPESVALASAMEMIVASPILFLVAGLRGEWTTFHLNAVTAAGWGALGYLIVFGSLAGFGSYIFLLVHEGPARASTNAFVNPLIAVALGAALAAEPVGPRTFVAAGMIVAAVGAVILGSSASPRARRDRS